jgi:hypothetical protein
MRPAYITRCPVCGIKITVPDEWQWETVMVNDKPVKVRWFCPDRFVQQHVRKTH